MTQWRGEALHQLQIVLREGQPVDRVEQLQDADDAPVCLEGDRQNRFRPERAAQLATPFRVCGHVVDDLSEPGLGHPADQALAQRHPAVTDLLRRSAAHQPKEQLLALPVHLPDRARLGAEELLRPVHRGLEDPLDIEAARQLDADVEKALVLLETLLQLCFHHDARPRDRRRV